MSASPDRRIWRYSSWTSPSIVPQTYGTPRPALAERPSSPKRAAVEQGRLVDPRLHVLERQRRVEHHGAGGAAEGGQHEVGTRRARRIRARLEILSVAAGGGERQPHRHEDERGPSDTARREAHVALPPARAAGTGSMISRIRARHPARHLDRAHSAGAASRREARTTPSFHGTASPGAGAGGLVAQPAPPPGSLAPDGRDGRLHVGCPAAHSALPARTVRPRRWSDGPRRAPSPRRAGVTSYLAPPAGAHQCPGAGSFRSGRRRDLGPRRARGRPPFR